MAVGEGQRMCGVDLSLAVAARYLLMLLLSILNGHLAKLSSEVGWTVTLVPRTALAAIDTREVTNN